MADYYELLGIARHADTHQIRAAYKRLAMQYHPDRNPGNKQAEEFFKTINEAYHVLSDPLKKSRYDARFFVYHTPANTTQDYWLHINRRKQHLYNWRQKQQQRYTFDKRYFKIQALSFLAFFIISGFCFVVIHSTYYFIEKKQAENRHINTLLLKKVNSLFIAGKVEDAFTLIDTLHEQDPAEFRFGFSRDSLVNELRNLAEEAYSNKHYSVAKKYYQLLKNYELATRIETLQRVASCEYFLGHYAEALVALKHLHHQQPWNVDILYELGVINFEKLQKPKEALHYFSQGKKLFKKNMTEVYGKAFEIVMDPEDVPDIYFDIFEARGRVNYQLGQYAEAITDCNWAIALRPSKGEPYHLRVLAKIKKHEYYSICHDIEMAKRDHIKGLETEERKYCKGLD